MMIDKAFYFSQAEFAMFAGKSGMQSVFGFSDNSLSNPDIGSYMLAMNKLVRNGLLKVGSDSLVVKSEVKKVFSVISSATLVLVLYPSNAFESVKCCYIFGSTVAVTEIPPSQKKKIKISLFDSYDFKEYLCNFGLSFLQEQENDDSLSTQTEEYLHKCGFNTNSSELCRLDGIDWVINAVNTETGAVFCKICLESDGLIKRLITLEEDGKMISEPYTQQQLETLIDGFCVRRDKK